MTAPRPDGIAGRARRCAARCDDAHVDAARDRLRERARQLDAAQRPDRDARDQAACSATTPPKLPVSSTKGYYGHALGASGAIEAAICALALERDWLPPTLNLDAPDDGCDLDYIPGAGREASVEYVAEQLLRLRRNQRRGRAEACTTGSDAST